MQTEQQYGEAIARIAPDLESAFSNGPSAVHAKLLDAYAGHMRGNGGLLPTRSGFDVSSLGSSLAHAVLYDVRDPERVEFRIVGEEMKQYFKVNPVGRSYLEFVPDERRAYARQAFRHCAEYPCAMLSETIQVFENGVGVPCSALGVPLMDDRNPGLASHLLFVDYPTSDDSAEFFYRSAFHQSYMVRRTFIDLGFGVPAGFREPVVKPPT